MFRTQNEAPVPVEGLVEIGRRGAELERPDRIVALAGGERPAADLVDAVADPLHPLAGEVIVRRRRGRAVVDDPRAGLEVVVDAVPDEPILAVEEDDLALGDGFTGIAVQLDAIREEPGRALGDLDIAGRDEQVVGAAHLLDLIGDDATFLSPTADDRRRPRVGPVPMPRATPGMSTAIRSSARAKQPVALEPGLRSGDWDGRAARAWSLMLSAGPNAAKKSCCFSGS